jgi:hypothetical protein
MELVFSAPAATARLSLVSRAAVAAPASRAGEAGAAWSRALVSEGSVSVSAVLVSAALLCRVFATPSGTSAIAGAALLVDHISRADSNALALAQVEAAFGTEFFLSSAVTRNRFVALVSIALTIE